MNDSELNLHNNMVNERNVPKYQHGAKGRGRMGDEGLPVYRDQRYKPIIVNEGEGIDWDSNPRRANWD